MSYFNRPLVSVCVERHETWCRPGCWRVLVAMAADVGESAFYSAVQDDFGNLVRVS